MDNDDDAIPPPIRRSPRAALEHHQAAHAVSPNGLSSSQTTPVGPRNRTNSLENSISRQNRPRAPRINPLGAHPIDTDGEKFISPQDFSHPFWEPLTPFQFDNPTPPLPVAPPLSHRSATGLKSYRNNKRLPLHIRRQASLETIVSVTTTPSLASDDDESDVAEEVASQVHSQSFEDDLATPTVPSHTSTLTSSAYSYDVKQPSITPITTSVPHEASDPHSPKALLRKLKSRKLNGSAPLPDRLVIERKVSFDRTSHHSNLASSDSSLASEHTERSRSGTSSEWSASNFDIASLNEAEIKKCKNKGINPALYAEMKAARKGKWTSPIAGNAFL